MKKISFLLLVITLIFTVGCSNGDYTIRFRDRILEPEEIAVPEYISENGREIEQCTFDGENIVFTLSDKDENSITDENKISTIAVYSVENKKIIDEFRIPCGRKAVLNPYYKDGSLYYSLGYMGGIADIYVTDNSETKLISGYNGENQQYLDYFCGELYVFSTAEEDYFYTAAIEKINGTETERVFENAARVPVWYPVFAKDETGTVIHFRDDEGRLYYLENGSLTEYAQTEKYLSMFAVVGDSLLLAAENENRAYMQITGIYTGTGTQIWDKNIGIVFTDNISKALVHTDEGWYHITVKNNKVTLQPLSVESTPTQTGFFMENGRTLIVQYADTYDLTVEKLFIIE